MQTINLKMPRVRYVVKVRLEVFMERLNVRNYKMGEFAVKIGVRHSRLSDIVYGRRSVSSDMGHKILSALLMTGQWEKLFKGDLTTTSA